MPFAQHLRLTMSGVLKTATGPILEQFSYRLNMSDPGTTQENFTLTAAQDFAADAVAFHGSVGGGMASMAVLTEVKLARIGPLGTYLADPFIVPVNQPGGGGGQVTHPFQIALAVSLGTARRGATGRGRFYLPLPSATITTAGVISTAARDGVATAVKAFLDDLNNASGLDFTNSKVTVASSKGYNSDVTEVRVGQVLDTIRSRRNNLVENYSAVLLIP
jgi:hypothetical protein